MITTSLIKIHDLKKLKRLFFLVIRTFKICSFSNFKIHTTELCTIVIMSYITSPELISYRLEVSSSSSQLYFCEK